jgi:predicted dehydrogenase
MESIENPDAASLTRRKFLSRAGKVAAAGVAFNGVAGAFAQQGGGLLGGGPPLPIQNPPTEFAGRRTRVAVVGIDHYHAISAPDYLRILKSESDVDIVGIHAPDIALATKYATMYNTTPFSDYRQMVEKTKPSFVVALGKHVNMPEEFRYLVSVNVPFLLEKPWATDEKTVNELASLAEAKKAWVCLPTPLRYSWFAEKAVAMRKAGEFGDLSNLVVRFNNAGIQRYIDLDNEWMLHKKEAGGGALVNLGIHGFDLCRYITDEEPTIVGALISNAKFRREVEDYSLITMKTPSGIVVMNEAGYTNTGSEHRLAAQKVNLVGLTMGGEGVEISVPGKSPTIERAPANYIAGWPGVVRDCLNRLYRGEGPLAGPRDGARASSLAFESYRIAGTSCMKPPLAS